MSIQGQFNQALGAIGTAAAVAKVSGELKENNELKKQEVASDLQGKEIDLVGALAQDTEAEAYSKQVLAGNEEKLANLEAAGTVTRDEKGRFIKQEARESAFNKAKEEMGYTINMNRESLKALQGQIAGKQKQLADVRARMLKMNVQSLLGGNE